MSSFFTSLKQPINLIAFSIVCCGFILQTILVLVFVNTVSCQSQRLSVFQRSLATTAVILFYLCCTLDASLVTIYFIKGNDPYLFFIVHTILAVIWDVSTMILYIFCLQRTDSLSVDNAQHKWLIFKPLDRANIAYNLVVILILIQLIVRVSTLTMSLEWIGTSVFFVTDAIISSFMLYCFVNIITQNLIQRKAFSINEGDYVAMNDDESEQRPPALIKFDRTDTKLMDVVIKLWILTVFIIVVNLLLGAVIFYRWYDFRTAPQWVLYGNWCGDVVVESLTILCIWLQFSVNKKWYDRLCGCCHRCSFVMMTNYIESKVQKRAQLQI